MSNRRCSFLLLALGFITCCANIGETSRGDQVEATIGLAIMLLGVFVGLPWKRAQTAKETEDGQ